MKTLILLLVAVSIASAVESGSKELWQEQMRKLDQMIAESKVSETKTQPQNRQSGLPFWGIGFEDEPKTFTTVHTLRPQDIDLVAGMGDSISAANGAGAATIVGLVIEYRGMCFSMGGDGEVEGSITLPNILKKFNPRLTGYSEGNGAPILYQEKYGFNVAVPGARADDMYGQAIRLINLLKNDTRSNYEDDWKLLTLFIGGNDLCALGRDPEGASPEAYVSEIKRALDLLHSEVPRMFINLVDILDIYLLPYVGYGYGSSATCRVMQNIFCGYVVDTMNDKDQEKHLRDINRQYQIQLQELIDSGIYDTRDDFTVVIQPFLRNSVLPYTEFGEVDATYFAPDCFHFSDVGHAMSAMNLWNNMLEPVGAKTTVWNVTDLKVPTKDRPYLFTSKNSDVPPSTTKPDPEPEQEATEVPVWTIVVMALLAVLLGAEAFVLVCMVTKGKKSKKNSESEKKGHFNDGAQL